ncbi:MAG: VPLPA-CTERM sorting domain-containing protein [Rhodobacteraceae bacterium]|nr:MAG: VPLPA-CTERM sorting domain-containing protein [Paracoccaceae bacterium]
MRFFNHTAISTSIAATFVLTVGAVEAQAVAYRVSVLTSNFVEASETLSSTSEAVAVAIDAEDDFNGLGSSHAASARSGPGTLGVRAQNFQEQDVFFDEEVETVGITTASASWTDRLTAPTGADAITLGFALDGSFLATGFFDSLSFRAFSRDVDSVSVAYDGFIDPRIGAFGFEQSGGAVKEAELFLIDSGFGGGETPRAPIDLSVSFTFGLTPLSEGPTTINVNLFAKSFFGDVDFSSTATLVSAFALSGGVRLQGPLVGELTGDLDVLTGQVQPIPLPAAGWLLFSGMAAMAAVGRRREA